MSGNPRENIQGRGFWDGGSKGHGSQGQHAGRRTGFPGRRMPLVEGLRIDLYDSATPKSQHPGKPHAGDDAEGATR